MEKLTKVRFSNLDKTLYPESGISKAKVIEYYIKIAPSNRARVGGLGAECQVSRS